MKNSRKKWMLAGLSGACLYLLCGGALAEGTGGAPQPENNTATGTGTNATTTEPRHEDTLERAFSPLDKAVSDINRDINSDAGPEHEDVLDRAFSPLDKAVSDVNRDMNSDIDGGDDKKAPKTNQTDQ